MPYDIRLAIRILVKTPSSTAIAVSILAVAIGVNTAVFSVVNAALLKLLPVRNPNELLMVTDPNASMVLGGVLTGERTLLGYEEFTRLRDRTKTLSGVCASQISLQRLPVRLAGGPQEQARGRLVSENYFSVFGVQAAIGRMFMGRDATGAGRDAYAVISYNYWRRRFGGSASVLGTTIRIHSATLVIIGVAAPGFRGETVGQDPDLWIPMLMQPLVMPGWDGLHDFMGHSQDKLMWLHVFGRRKPAVSMAQVQAEVDVALPANPRSGLLNFHGVAAATECAQAESSRASRAIRSLSRPRGILSAVDHSIRPVRLGSVNRMCQYCELTTSPRGNP